jgi:REP element-mobilizing transposase RayT
MRFMPGSLMPNHVHLLLTPQVGMAKPLNALKATTARRANLPLARSGKPFWQGRSCDHAVRGRAEFGRIRPGGKAFGNILKAIQCAREFGGQARG